MTESRFGKPSGPLLSHKGAFFSDNDALLKRQHEIAQLYRRQPLRTECKNCDHGISDQPDFVKWEVGYTFCKTCGHLNGMHQDTADFCSALYLEGESKYAQTYTPEDEDRYQKRVEDIYNPKAEFLVKSLSKVTKPESLKFLDLGAGCGYFVKALLNQGLKHIVGYEISETQVRMAHQMMPEAYLKPLRQISEVLQVAQSDANVVSMIGVLEHLQQPRETLKALSENPSVEFLYLSVPMMSPSVFIELAFPQVMQRHLSGGHTHLYTSSSIDWIGNEFGFSRLSEWWFGSDLVDFFRSVQVTLNQQGQSAAGRLWAQSMAPHLDALQLVIDQNRQSSELHVLLRRKR